MIRIISRRSLLGGVAALIAAPLTVEAQQGGSRRIMRVGILSALGSAAVSDPFVITVATLRELGWIEGENIRFERRYAEAQNDRLPSLAAELVELKADVIITTTTPAVLALKRVTSTIPIVAAGIADPVGTGLVRSMSRPGGNITGLASFASELNGKRLQLLGDVVPNLKNVVVLTNPRSPASVAAVAEVRQAADRMGIDVQLVEISRPEELDKALERVARGEAQGLLVPNEPVLFPMRARLAEFCLKQRLPSVYGYKQHAEAGGLMTYAPSYEDIYRRSAVYVDKILKGAKPGELPIEQPTRVELIINMKTAKALGLTIPPALLLRADQVIE